MAEPVRVRRLTDQEGQKLQQIVRRGGTSSVRFRRAMMLLASAGGGALRRSCGGVGKPAPRARAGVRRRLPLVVFMHCALPPHGGTASCAHTFRAERAVAVGVPLRCKVWPEDRKVGVRGRHLADACRASGTAPVRTGPNRRLPAMPARGATPSHALVGARHDAVGGQPSGSGCLQVEFGGDLGDQGGKTVGHRSLSSRAGGAAGASSHTPVRRCGPCVIDCLRAAPADFAAVPGPDQTRGTLGGVKLGSQMGLVGDGGVRWYGDAYD